MQYKIPIQIENEDVIFAGLSIRQLIIMMAWGGVGYGIFKYAEPYLGAQVAAVFAVPFAVIGIVVALTRISEMTFLPAILAYVRLNLNARSRLWSQGTDSYSDLLVGYIAENQVQKWAAANKTYSQIDSDDTLAEQISKL